MFVVMNMFARMLRNKRELTVSRAAMTDGGFFVAISFLIGATAAFALLHMKLISLEDILFLRRDNPGLVWALLRYCVCVVALFFLATSVWGSALVPLLTALTAAHLTLDVFVTVQLESVWMLILRSIPMSVFVAAFFILAIDSAAYSRDLSAMWRGLPRTSPVPLLRHCLMILPILAFAAVFDAYLIPMVLSRYLS